MYRLTCGSISHVCGMKILETVITETTFIHLGVCGVSSYSSCLAFKIIAGCLEKNWMLFTFDRAPHISTVGFIYILVFPNSLNIFVDSKNECYV